MTRQSVHRATSAFSEWLRRLPAPYNSMRFDCQNLDYVWFAYRDGWLILIEEKMNGAVRTFAQRDTHRLVHQMLEAASGGIYETARGRRPIEYRGYYNVAFEHSDPDDSAWVRVNGVMYPDAKAAILSLLWDGRQPRERAA